MKKMETTLLLLRKDNEILLAMKKRGFGEGKFNGVGGKIKENETPEEAMIRECKEEIVVTPTDYFKIGIFSFIEYYKGEKENIVFHLYVANDWVGEPQETEEMRPQWFAIDKIPYEQMFTDDRYWMPYVLQGKKINGFFEFDEEWKLLSHKIEEIN